MKIGILLFFGLLSAMYGIVVLQVGSGTSFWLIWEVIGICFFFLVLLLHKDFFKTYQKLGMALNGIVAVGVIVIIVLCTMIATEFKSRGNSDMDYIIVLGAQVKDDGPSVVLRYRLDAAIEYLNVNPKTKCIVSGGQGSNERISEAEGMAEYLLKNGIEKSRIILEDKSKNTVENIKNSKMLMEKSYESVGIVTNNFHVFRAVHIAKTQGLQGVCGIAAKSSALYLPNNVLRECLGILKDWVMGNL